MEIKRYELVKQIYNTENSLCCKLCTKEACKENHEMSCFESINNYLELLNKVKFTDTEQLVALKILCPTTSTLNDKELKALWVLTEYITRTSILLEREGTKRC